MTILCAIELKCPCCGNLFSSQTWRSSNTFGQSSTDLHRRAIGIQSLHYELHTCMECAFTGYPRDFDEAYDLTISPDLLQRIREQLAPQLHSEDGIFPGKKFELAACIAEWQGASAVAIGDLYLRAAWCCADEERREDEFYYRRQAIDYFTRSLQGAEIPHEGVAIYTYLVGELYRRTGDRDNATLWFNRTQEEVGHETDKQWIAELACQQRDSPREFY